MSNKRLECLGETVNMKACFGPDESVSRELGYNACITCVIPAFRQMAAENQKLRTHAERDGLTALLNRRMFDNALQNKVKTGERFGILFIDLEFFKVVNDRELHVGGDEILKKTASYLDEFFSKTLRREDLVARIGGDEFGVILNPSRESGVLDADAIQVIKDRLRDNFVDVPIVSEYNQRYGNIDSLAMHVGHAIWEPGMTATDMMTEADPPKRQSA